MPINFNIVLIWVYQVFALNTIEKRYIYSLKVFLYLRTSFDIACMHVFMHACNAAQLVDGARVDIPYPQLNFG